MTTSELSLLHEMKGTRNMKASCCRDSRSYCVRRVN